MLGDNYGHEEGSVESGGSPLSTSEEDGKGNSSNLDLKEMVSRPASSVKSYIDLDAVIVVRDEQQTLLFAKEDLVTF